MTNITITGDAPAWVEDYLGELIADAFSGDYAMTLTWKAPKTRRDGGVACLSGISWKSKHHMEITEHHEPGVAFDAGPTIANKALIVHEFAHLVPGNQRHDREFYRAAYLLAAAHIEDGVNELWKADAWYRAMATRVAAEDFGLEPAVAKMEEKKAKAAAKRKRQAECDHYWEIDYTHDRMGYLSGGREVCIRCFKKGKKLSEDEANRAQIEEDRKARGSR